MNDDDYDEGGGSDDDDNVSIQDERDSLVLSSMSEPYKDWFGFWQR
jgi:hypothetical protein